MQIEEHLKHLEERLIDPLVRSDAESVASLIADDFREFGSSGRCFDKASIIEELSHEPFRPAPTLIDFSARFLAAEVVLVTYRTVRQRSSRETMERSWRSSIWVNREDRWQLVFHQGTRIPQHFET
jgi:hypothetical protein